MTSSSKVINNVRLIQKCIIVNKDQKILALKRIIDDHSRGGCWDLPGGGYEQGEEVISAIKREVKEEVGLNVIEVKPVYFTNRLGITVGFFEGDTVFATTYVSHHWKGEITLSSEHVDYLWVTPQEFLTLEFGSDDGYFVDSMNAYLALPSMIDIFKK